MFKYLLRFYNTPLMLFIVTKKGREVNEFLENLLFTVAVFYLSLLSLLHKTYYLTSQHVIQDVLLTL